MPSTDRQKLADFFPYGCRHHIPAGNEIAPHTEVTFQQNRFAEDVDAAKAALCVDCGSNDTCEARMDWKPFHVLRCLDPRNFVRFGEKRAVQACIEHLLKDRELGADTVYLADLETFKAGPVGPMASVLAYVPATNEIHCTNRVMKQTYVLPASIAELDDNQLRAWSAKNPTGGTMLTMEMLLKLRELVRG